jgi:hypothetical protein
LEEILEKIGVVVPIMTPRYKKDAAADNELALVRKYQKPIKPILVIGNPSEAIPTRLAVYSYVDATRDYRAGIQKLVAAIQDSIERSS